MSKSMESFRNAIAQITHNMIGAFLQDSMAQIAKWISSDLQRSINIFEPIQRKCIIQKKTQTYTIDSISPSSTGTWPTLLLDKSRVARQRNAPKPVGPTSSVSILLSRA